MSRFVDMKRHERDGLVVGDDGVVRAFDANGFVLDYVRLSNAELAIFESHVPPEKKKYTLVSRAGQRNQYPLRRGAWSQAQTMQQRHLRDICLPESDLF